MTREYHQMCIAMDLTVASLVQAIKDHKRRFGGDPKILYVGLVGESEGKRILFNPEFSYISDAFFKSDWTIVVDPDFEDDEWCISVGERCTGSKGA